MYRLIELQKGKHYGIVIETGKDPFTGKRNRLNRRFKGRKADAEALAEKLWEMVKHGTHLHEKTTLSEYLDSWLVTHGSNLAPTTTATYKAIINNHIKPHLGRIKLCDLTAVRIQEYYATKLKENLSPRSVQQHHSVLSRSLNQAARLKLILYSPTINVTSPQPEGKVAKTLSVEQMVDLLSKFKGHKYEAVYITAAYTGMRLGEVLGLRWDDVALPTVYVCQSLTRVAGETVYRRPKSGKTRGLIVPHVVMEAINSLDKQGDLVFSHPGDKPYTPSVVSRYFIQVAKDSGYNIRFHDMRHSYGTQLAEMGEHVQVVQEALGHHSPAFTLSRYTHAFKGPQQSIADKYNQKLDGTNKAQKHNGVKLALAVPDS